MDYHVPTTRNEQMFTNILFQLLQIIKKESYAYCHCVSLGHAILSLLAPLERLYLKLVCLCPLIHMCVCYEQAM